MFKELWAAVSFSAVVAGFVADFVAVPVSPVIPITGVAQMVLAVQRWRA